MQIPCIDASEHSYIGTVSDMLIKHPLFVLLRNAQKAAHCNIFIHNCIVLQAPTAEGFACSPDGHILAVSSSADILAMGNHLTKRVDLQGSFVTPVCLTSFT